MNKLTTKELELQAILNDIKEYVIVTGSYAEGTQKSSSDIDFYIKLKPEDEVDLEANFVEDTYCQYLMKYFESRGYELGSVFITSFHVDDTFIPLEFSHFYQIDENNTFEIEILGVKLQASKSLYTKS